MQRASLLRRQGTRARRPARGHRGGARARLRGRAGQRPGVAARAQVPHVHAAALRAVQQLPRPGRHLQHRALARRRLPQACAARRPALSVHAGAPGGGRRAVCAHLIRVAGAPHSNACVSARARMPCPSRLAEHALALTYCEPPFCHPPIAGQPSMHTRRASTARLLHAMTHLARAFLQGLVGGRAHRRCRCSGRRCRRARCTPRATRARCRRRCRTRRCCRPRTP